MDNYLHAKPAVKLQASGSKSTIATKKGSKTKKTLGAKKVAKIDFDSIEKSIQEEKKLEEQSVSSMASDVSKETKSSGQSLQLAYEGLAIQEKQNDNKIDGMSDEKRAVAQRLGMGVGTQSNTVGGVSHSLKMVEIEQTQPVRNSSRKKQQSYHRDFYRHQGSSVDGDDDEFFDCESDGFVVVGSGKSKRSYMNPSKSQASESYDVIQPIEPTHRADRNLFGENIGGGGNDKSKNQASKSKQTSSSSSRDKKPSQSASAKDYDSCKSISSDQLFGGDHSQKMNDERSYVRMEGRSGISSDDFYGRKPKVSASSRASALAANHVPDLYDVKEGVRQGVRSMAGKLSSVVGAISDAIEDRRFT